MEETKKRFYLILLCAIAAAGIVIAVIIFLFGNHPEQHEPATESKGPITPSGQLRVEDLYEGERLIPKYELPRCTYDLSKFHDKQNGVITYSDLDASLGVDVSEYQGEIDWQQVQDAGVEFALLRLGYRGYTQGLMYVDEKFETNYKNASEVGMPLGVYFFSQAITEAEAEAEADFVLETLGSRTLEYPIIFDWEHPYPSEKTPVESLRAYHCGGKLITKMAAAFCERIRKKSGYTPAVYFNKNMAYDVLNLEELGAYDFWYAEYQKRPSLYYDFSIWQYTESGSIPGIGTVDLNIAFKRYP